MDPERLIQKNVDTSTASDVTHLLYQIESGSALSCQMRELALDILKSQRLSSRLPAKLPPNIEVAHKTGTIGSVVNDAGIIYVPATEKKFALTVFTKDCPDKAQAEAFIASVATEIFEFIKDKY